MHSTDQQQAARGSRITVVIVEDQEITRLGLRLVLEQNADVEIVGEADDGQVGVTKALELAPDVVLMDVGLPTIDGIEATRQIKGANPNIRVIMLTTHDHADDVFAALTAGADGYCLKETKADAIVSAMRLVMEGVVSLDSRIARALLTHVQLGENAKQTPVKDEKFGLSPRELEILKLLMDGCSNLQMADRLIISPETVKTHMRHIMEKLMVSDRTQAAVKAMRAGIFRPEQVS
jgi:DNA-binding NarL/FixJ family response regulator